ncbi:homocitrate synthase family protein [Candidatus Hecatella orcuttiae]|uniref:homocitrate synthase family protein n=1 Tax=Candidatus Hecatella orcuttiae TaxID=1935119 RepID=UPI002867F5F1|nr:homocitrate synthase family protein [Candidatus Hecatella orcuttiae]
MDTEMDPEEDCFLSPYTREPNLNGQIQICDTTLRDGHQTPGVVFTVEEKVEIAKLLDEIGIHQIEAGVPVSSPREEEALRRIVKEVKHASVMGWCRAVPRDVDSVVRCGADAVTVSMATSDLHLKHKLKISRQEAIERMKQSVLKAKSAGLYVSVTAEDGTRTSYEALLQFTQAAKEAGADRLRLADTVGAMHPTAVSSLVRRLLKDGGLPIEIHAHNDLGLAVANSFAAVEGGASWISTTVNGLGERAGNAALEPVVVGLKFLYRKDLGLNLKRLPELSSLVEKASGIPVGHFAPIVGANMFNHSSGIHVHGLISHPRTYQLVVPEDVGREMNITIDKYSGKAAVQAKLERLGISFPEKLVDQLRERLVEKSYQLKRGLTDREFEDTLQEFTGDIRLQR